MPEKVPSILGPVTANDSFLIVSLNSGNPEILNGATHDSGIIYYWESSLSTVAQSAKLPVFVYSGESDAIKISDQNNKGGISFRSNGVTIGNADEPVEIQLDQSSYATWNPPNNLLSAVTYTLKNSNGTTGQVFTKPDVNSDTRAATNIIILPTVWYLNCTADGMYSSTTISSSILSWFCAVNSNISECKDQELATSGWTVVDDCIIGDKYRYCLPDSHCGDQNCKGPCPSDADDCTYRKSDKSYFCKFDPARFFNDTKWYDSPLFFGTIAGLLVLAILVFLIGRSIGRKVVKQKTQPKVISL